MPIFMFGGLYLDMSPRRLMGKMTNFTSFKILVWEVGARQKIFGTFPSISALPLFLPLLSFPFLRWKRAVNSKLSS